MPDELNLPGEDAPASALAAGVFVLLPGGPNDPEVPAFVPFDPGNTLEGIPLDFLAF